MKKEIEKLKENIGVLRGLLQPGILLWTNQTTGTILTMFSQGMIEGTVVNEEPVLPTLHLQTKDRHAIRMNNEKDLYIATALYLAKIVESA